MRDRCFILLFYWISDFLRCEVGLWLHCYRKEALSRVQGYVSLTHQLPLRGADFHQDNEQRSWTTNLPVMPDQI